MFGPFSLSYAVLSLKFCNHLAEERSVGCFTLFVVTANVPTMPWIDLQCVIVSFLGLT